MTKIDIKKVMEAELLVCATCHRNGYSVSDLSEKEYIEEVNKILTDKKYKRNTKLYLNERN
jgi:hypothetical protein